MSHIGREWHLLFKYFGLLCISCMDAPEQGAECRWRRDGINGSLRLACKNALVREAEAVRQYVVRFEIKMLTYFFERGISRAFAVHPPGNGCLRNAGYPAKGFLGYVVTD